MLLKDKTILITGSSRGIGKAIALKCARNGANVIINCSSSDNEVTSLLKEINNMGVSRTFIKADISKKNVVDKLKNKGKFWTVGCSCK